MRVLIVGAGLGGLALAQGLSTMGIDCMVIERDPSATARGQGYRITLKDTGAKALRDCLPADLFALARATALRPATRMVFLDPDLRTRFAKPLPAVDPATDDGLGGFGVNRLTLRQILLTGLGGRVRFGQTFRRYEQVGDRVRAVFADGTSMTADLLVGADGTGSAVRGQLRPEAGVDELSWAVYGRTPITAGTLAWLPEMLLDSFNRVTGESHPDSDAGGAGFAVATCRTREPVAAAAARLAPAANLTPVPDYLQWITPLLDRRLRTGDAAALHRHAGELVHGFHPGVQRIVAEADVAATFAVRITSARPVQPWDTPNVTLLGDAIHTMSPGRGDGANIALRDAQVLGAALGRVGPGEQSLADAVGEYQTDMLRYGFAAVRASLRQPFRGPAEVDSATPSTVSPAAAWELFAATHAVGDPVEATVTGSLPAGVFVEVTPGVAGILVGVAPTAGCRVRGRITAIDAANRRFSLAPTG